MGIFIRNDPSDFGLSFGYQRQGPSREIYQFTDYHKGDKFNRPGYETLAFFRQ